MNGLLLLTKPTSKKLLHSYFDYISRKSTGNLYVYLGSVNSSSSPIFNRELIEHVYGFPSKNLTPFILLPNSTFSNVSIDKLYTDVSELVKYQKACSNLGLDNQEIDQESLASLRANDTSNAPEDSFVSTDTARYENVCMGGTFDELHCAHKSMLQIGAHLASKRFVIGVTEDDMVKNKVLCQLIHPFEVRSASIRHFLVNIGFPVSKVEIVKLSDPYGPPAEEPDFQVIVASAETAKSCEELNKKREEKGFPPLIIEAIGIVSSQDESFILPEGLRESKICSTSNRLNKLGVRLTRGSAPKPSREGLFVIGLTGCGTAGKTSLTQKMLSLHPDRVHVIECDKLGHQAYEPDTVGFTKVVEAFGQCVVDVQSNSIDRKALGQIVFSSPEKLALLESIVWQEIRAMVQKELADLQAISSENNPKLVVVDAAVLIEAGWHVFCDELWISLVSRAEAKRRFCARSLSAEESEKRLSAQSRKISEATKNGSHVADWWSPCQLGANYGPLRLADRVFCTEWEQEFTMAQVKRALDDLL